MVVQQDEQPPGGAGMAGETQPHPGTGINGPRGADPHGVPRRRPGRGSKGHRDEEGDQAAAAPDAPSECDAATLTNRLRSAAPCVARHRATRPVSSATLGLPEHFLPVEPSPFGELVGPLYMSDTGEAPILAVRVAPQHANRVGRAHGGLLMTLADVAVSRATVARLPPGSTIATASLQIAFQEGVTEGQWLEALASIDRLGRSLAHASCVIQADGRAVARVLATVSIRLGNLG